MPAPRCFLRAARHPARALLLSGACAATVLGLGLGPAGPAPAQSLGNSLVSTTISQRLEADTNYDLDDPSPGTSYFTDTTLGLSLLNETPIQSITLGFETGVRAFWEADEDFDLTFASPTTVEADYLREWVGGSIDAGVRYRQTRVDFDRPLADVLEEDLDEDDLDLLPDGIEELPDDTERIQGETIEQRYDANVALELATNAPSSYEFTLATTRFEYSDDGSTRTPRSSIQGRGLWTLRLTPVLSSAVLARYYLFEADNLAETRIREAELDAGVIYVASDRLRLTAGLGYVDRLREQTQRNGEVVEVENGTGPALRAGARYRLNGLVINADTRLSDTVPERRLSGNLRLTYPVRPDTLVNARLFRRYIGNSRGQEVELTGAGLGVERELSSVSSVGLDFAVANQANEDNPDAADVRRLDATATYTRELTAAVSADIGYRFRNRDEDPDSATSHAVFFEIGRTFDTRF